jgi:hypothetical protein
MKLLPYISPSAAEPMNARVGDVGVWKAKVAKAEPLGEYIQRVALHAING